MKAESGAELACKARSNHFEDDGRWMERGVISHYASRMLAQATTVESWVQLMNDSSESDLKKGFITPLHKPALQFIGDPAVRIPGNPVKGTYEGHE